MTTTLDIDERVEKCRKILDTDPNSQIFAALAEAYRRKGDLEKAFRVCQNGLKIHPSYGSAHVVMAKINLDRRLYDWAEIEAKKAAEIDGWTRATEMLLAEIHIYKGEFAPAIKLLNRLHEGDPESTQIRKLLEIARQLPRQQAESMDPISRTRVAVPQQVQTPEKSVRVGSVPSVLSVAETLKQSIAIPGVDGALFTNFEGLIIESQWTISEDPDTYAVTVGEIGNRLKPELVQEHFGKVRTVLIETQGRTLYLVWRDDGIMLFVANASANLGALRIRIEGLLGRQLQGKKDEVWK